MVSSFGTLVASGSVSVSSPGYSPFVLIVWTGERISMVVLESEGMLTAGSNQYLQPDYLSSVSTTVSSHHFYFYSFSKKSNLDFDKSQFWSPAQSFIFLNLSYHSLSFSYFFACVIWFTIKSWNLVWKLQFVFCTFYLVFLVRKFCCQQNLNL